MRTINLNSNTGIDIFATSSKGNQPKWFLNNKWYKTDCMGYEALSEYVISELLKKSNAENFVNYDLIKININKKTYNGCCSDNFKPDGYSVITLEHLAKSYMGSSLSKELTKYSDVSEKIKRTVDFTEKTTNLKNVGQYLALMLELDMFFLNEDRHTNNISFLKNDNTNEFRFCPYYDFGLSLFSDTLSDYPLNGDIYNYRKKIKAKPFSTDFEEQTECAEKLYGEQLKFYFTSSDIENILSQTKEYYDDNTVERVKNLLYYQKSRYGYLFK